MINSPDPGVLDPQLSDILSFQSIERSSSEQMGLLFRVIAAQPMVITLQESYWYQCTKFKKEVFYMSAPLDAFYIPPGVSWSPYLVPLGPPCFFLGTPLGLPGSSPSRGFCMFATFTSFCMFSSRITVFFKHEDIWVSGGAQVAIRRGPAHPLPYGFSVFPLNTEM